jgi:hypothetical protein
MLRKYGQSIKPLFFQLFRSIAVSWRVCKTCRDKLEIFSMPQIIQALCEIMSAEPNFSVLRPGLADVGASNERLSRSTGAWPNW